ncbi:hypothetical protein RBSWK_00112 [Rhodopirellula baltica SWK14]|uniref:Uncharacterized protein n=1 Tax=Rhodopirellula baltica SWK14 TaxID=993516 RepID=L7CQ28_RHOBT|nr:hypothetical protein RBSWK_00112 [Rhodopirellula baltica SWK14]
MKWNVLSKDVRRSTKPAINTWTGDRIPEDTQYKLETAKANRCESCVPSED